EQALRSSPPLKFFGRRRSAECFAPWTRYLVRRLIATRFLVDAPSSRRSEPLRVPGRGAPERILGTSRGGMESSFPPPRVDIANRPRATSRIDPRRVDDVSLSSAIEQRTVADFFNGGRSFRPS